MKTKILIIVMLAAVACLPLEALAYERNFPAGSIIIPMDNYYQPVQDGGQLEAYGLTYYLLDRQDQECLADQASFADAQQVGATNRECIEESSQLVG